MPALVAECALVSRAGLSCMRGACAAEDSVRIAVATRDAVEATLLQNAGERTLVWTDPLNILSGQAPISLAMSVAGCVRHMAFPLGVAKVQSSQTPTPRYAPEDDPAVASSGYATPLGHSPRGLTSPRLSEGSAGAPPVPILPDTLPVAARLTLHAKAWDSLRSACDRLLPTLEYLLADMEHCGLFFPAEAVAAPQLLESRDCVVSFAQGGFLITTKDAGRGRIDSLHLCIDLAGSRLLLLEPAEVLYTDAMGTPLPHDHSTLSHPIPESVAALPRPGAHPGRVATLAEALACALGGRVPGVTAGAGTSGKGGIKPSHHDRSIAELVSDLCAPGAADRVEALHRVHRALLAACRLPEAGAPAGGVFLTSEWVSRGVTEALVGVVDVARQLRLAPRRRSKGRADEVADEVAECIRIVLGGSDPETCAAERFCAAVVDQLTRGPSPPPVDLLIVMASAVPLAPVAASPALAALQGPLVAAYDRLSTDRRGGVPSAQEGAGPGRRLFCRSLRAPAGDGLSRRGQEDRGAAGADGAQGASEPRASEGGAQGDRGPLAKYALGRSASGEESDRGGGSGGAGLPGPRAPYRDTWVGDAAAGSDVREISVNLDLSAGMPLGLGQGAGPGRVVGRAARREAALADGSAGPDAFRDHAAPLQAAEELHALARAVGEGLLVPDLALMMKTRSEAPRAKRDKGGAGGTTAEPGEVVPLVTPAQLAGPIFSRPHPGLLSASGLRRQLRAGLMSLAPGYARVLWPGGAREWEEVAEALDGYLARRAVLETLAVAARAGAAAGLGQPGGPRSVYPQLWDGVSSEDWMADWGGACGVPGAKGSGPRKCAWLMGQAVLDRSLRELGLRALNAAGGDAKGGPGGGDGEGPDPLVERALEVLVEAGSADAGAWSRWRRDASVQLYCLAHHVSCSTGVGVARAVAARVGPALLSLLSRLCDRAACDEDGTLEDDVAAFDDWQFDDVLTLQALVTLLASMAHHAAGTPLGRALLSTLVQDPRHLGLLRAFTRFALLCTPATPLPPGRRTALQLAVLWLWRDVAALLRGATDAGDEGGLGPETELALPASSSQLPASMAAVAGILSTAAARCVAATGTRVPVAACLARLRFLLSVEGSCLAALCCSRVPWCCSVSGVGDKDRRSVGVWPDEVVMAALEVLRELLSVRPCLALQDPGLASHYVHASFLSFVRLYHGDPAALLAPAQRRAPMHSGPGPTPPFAFLRSPHRGVLTLVRGHLDALLALALSDSPAAHARLTQLRVMDLLVHEVALEHDMLHHAAAVGSRAVELWRGVQAGCFLLSKHAPGHGPAARERERARKLAGAVVVKTGKGSTRLPKLQLPVAVIKGGTQSDGEEALEASPAAPPPALALDALSAPRAPELTGDVEVDATALERHEREVERSRKRKTGTESPFLSIFSPKSVLSRQGDGDRAGRSGRGGSAVVGDRGEWGGSEWDGPDTPGPDGASPRRARRHSTSGGAPWGALDSGPGSSDSDSDGLPPPSPQAGRGMGLALPGLESLRRSRVDSVPPRPSRVRSHHAASATSPPSGIPHGPGRPYLAPGPVPALDLRRTVEAQANAMERDALSDDARRQRAPRERVEFESCYELVSTKGYEGALTELQKRMTGRGAKLQVARRKGEPRARRAAQRLEIMRRAEAEWKYLIERTRRPLFRNPMLQVACLKAILALAVRSDGTLSPLYCQASGVDRHAPNVPALLHAHLSHRLNYHAVPDLVVFCDDLPPAQGAGVMRLLRLTAPCLFRPSLYASRERIARGAFATVHRCQMPALGGPRTVVLKAIDLPTSASDHSAVVDAFEEVRILEALNGLPWACGLHDYGVDDHHIYLVLEDLALSLRDWRAALPSAAASARPLLRVFAAVVDAVVAMAERGVVHYDLKCDNVLLAPLDPAAPWESLWDLDRLPFRVVLADFGESRLFRPGDDPATRRNRGTEFVKSPEMLQVAHARRAGTGVGPPADVWSLGCLLYELTTGELLFYDPDWIRFFIRLTQDAQPLFPEARLATLNEIPDVAAILRYILVRDPRQRPSLAQVRARVHEVLAAAAPGAPATPPPPTGPLGLPHLRISLPSATPTASSVSASVAFADAKPPPSVSSVTSGAPTTAADRAGSLAQARRARAAARAPNTRALEASDVSALLPMHAWRAAHSAAAAPGLLVATLPAGTALLGDARELARLRISAAVVLSPQLMAFGSSTHAEVASAKLLCHAAHLPCHVVEVPGASPRGAWNPASRDPAGVALMPMLRAVNLILRHIAAARGGACLAGLAAAATPTPDHDTSPSRASVDAPTPEAPGFWAFPGPLGSTPHRASRASVVSPSAATEAGAVSVSLGRAGPDASTCSAASELSFGSPVARGAPDPEAGAGAAQSKTLASDTGTVLLLYADGTEADATAAAVAYVMLSMGLTLFQSVLHVQRRCLRCHLSPAHVQLLSLWSQQVADKAARWAKLPVVTCPCHASRAAITAPKGHPVPLTHCRATAPGRCPVACQPHAARIASRSDDPSPHPEVHWAHLTETHIDVDPVSPLVEATPAEATVEPGWALFLCAHCRCPVLALGAPLGAPASSQGTPQGLRSPPAVPHSPGGLTARGWPDRTGLSLKSPQVRSPSYRGRRHARAPFSPGSSLSGGLPSPPPCPPRPALLCVNHFHGSLAEFSGVLSSLFQTPRASPSSDAEMG